MANWTWGEIRQKVRQVSGRYSTDELTNDKLLEFGNRYIQYTFPAEVKVERIHTFYEFLTSANQQSYTLPDGYVNFEPTATIDRLSVLWYQDPVAFYENNPEQVGRLTLGTGDGSTTTFSGTANGYPILPGTAVITDQTEIFQDTSTSYSTATIALTGDQGGTGTINLSTGAVSVTFNTAPASGVNVYFSFIQFRTGRPTAVLLYNNKFTFYPVPDTSYRFRSKAYSNSAVQSASGTVQQTFQLTTDRPLLDEWGPAIAYGIARDVVSNYGEMDAYQEISALYDEQLSYIMRRTEQNLLNTRAQPQF